MKKCFEIDDGASVHACEPQHTWQAWTLAAKLITIFSNRNISI